MSLEEIKNGALKLKALREKKEELTAQLKEVNESISELEEHDLDSLMTDANVTDVTVGGVRVRKGVIFRGGCTSSDNKDPFQFLFDTNNDDALKKKVVIDLVDEPDAIQKIADMGLKHNVNYSIHHMTLSSLIRDMVEEGQLSTDDLIKYKIYAQPVIKVEVKK